MSTSDRLGSTARTRPHREGHTVTGMEHATEIIRRQIERQADRFESIGASAHVEVEGSLTPYWIAEALAEAGLLTPAPLREEWAARYVNGGGAICPTRDEAEAALDRMTRDSHRHRVDEPPAPEIAGIYARYVSDWLPVDRAEGDGRAEQ